MEVVDIAPWQAEATWAFHPRSGSDGVVASRARGPAGRDEVASALAH
jgi:hypothetical protein